MTVGGFTIVAVALVTLVVAGCDLDIVGNIYGASSGDYSPTWTPDGKHIVFSGYRWRDGRADLYEVDADGRNEHVLSGTVGAHGPAVSPDGTRIVFYKGGDLFLAHADGSNAERFGTHTRLSEEAPAWSPDGKQLAFSRRIESDGWDPEPEWLLVARADGTGAPRRLVRTVTQMDADASYDTQSPTWSPDGRLIAYHASNGIYVIPSAGGEPQLIAGGNLRMPAWAPHTNRLAAVTGNTIKILQLHGRGRARIIRAVKVSGLESNGLGALAWGPHERKIAFSGADGYSGDSCLFALDLKDGSVAELTSPEHECTVHAKEVRVGRPS